MEIEIGRSVSKFVQDVKKGSITFPLKKNRYSEKEIRNMFRRLKSVDPRNRYILLEECRIGGLGDDFDPSFLEWGGDTAISGDKYKTLWKKKYLQVTSERDDYYDFNQLSDMFNELPRMKARACTEKHSPYDFFSQYSEKVAEECLKRYGTLDDEYYLRETVFVLVRECTAFRPLIIRCFISQFGAKKVFDFSAGWGDRLLGAMASDVEYLGLDPNPDLQEGYQKMISMFGNPKKHRVLEQCAETYCPEKKLIGTFDLVFTSPPFFDTEIYRENDPKQSSNYCSDIVEWLDKFLYPSLDLSVKMLRKGGILAINLKQKSKKEEFIYWMFDYISKFYGGEVRRLGMISYINERKVNPQPIWVWQKL